MIIAAGKSYEMLENGRKAMEDSDPLVITPFENPKELQFSNAASIDLRLGTWFLTLKQSKLTHLAIGENTRESQLTKQYYEPFGEQYLFHPQCFVLGATLEWIRLPSDVAGYVVGKSSRGRRGLIIETAAGVHPGFSG